MAIDTTLFAWARPLDIDPKLDHTWVTDYQPAAKYADIQSVTAANKNYWFCWGAFHDDDYRAIGDAGAIFSVAQCLVTPNDSNAHGTIFRYAIDGVCHQLANQVLYSTQTKLVVSKARGYRISSFLYGTYGLQKSAWAQKIAGCTAGAGAGAGVMDEFELALKTALGDRATPDKIEALNNLRAEFQASIQDMGKALLFTGDPQSKAATINDKITGFMQEARKILGDDGFKAMFETEIADTYKLVDPEMLAVSEAELAKNAEQQSEE